MKRILAALDLGPLTGSVIARTSEWAGAFQAKVCLLHVEAPEPDFVGFDPGPQTVCDNVAREILDDQHEMNRLAGQLHERGVETKAMLLQGATA